MKKGFTLVELLAVIVILGVISTITYNIIAGNIKETRKKSFEISATNLLESTKEYVTKYMENNDFPEGGISVLDSNLGIDNNKFTSGLIVRSTDDKIELVNVSDGNYCANGSKNDLQISEGDCASIDDTAPTLKLKLIKSSTTSAQIMVKTQDSGSGINNYEFCYGKDSIEMESNCTKYEKNNQTTLIKDIIKLDDLQPNQKYIVSVTAENNADNEKIKKTTSELEITTKLVDEPTFSISSGTYATTKELTIIYPENTGDYIYKYDVTIPNGEEVPTKVLNQNINQDTIEINSIMTVHAYIEKNNELINENSITINGIDIEPPKVNLVIPNINDWTKEKTLTIEATDNGVGLALRPYAFDQAKNWNKVSELTIVTSTDLYIHTRDRLGNISNEFTINDSLAICNTTTKICKINNIDSLGPDISIEIVSGTNKNGYYIDDVKLKITIVDKYLYNGIKVTGGVGFDESSLKITKNGTLLQTESNEPLTYYVTLKENTAVNDVIKVVAADKLGNTSEATKEVKIDRQAPILSTYQSQIGLNTGVDYPYTNNISAKYGPLGGSIVCNPTNNNVMVGTKTTVNCTATGNNGLVSTISFIGAHQYPARYVHQTCGEEVCTESGCCEWSWDGGCASTGGNCTSTQFCIDDGCCSSEYRTYDCSFYDCPNGGRLSGTTCVF